MNNTSVYREGKNFTLPTAGRRARLLAGHVHRTVIRNMGECVGNKREGAGRLVRKQGLIK